MSTDPTWRGCRLLAQTLGTIGVVALILDGIGLGTAIGTGAIEWLIVAPILVWTPVIGVRLILWTRQTSTNHVPPNRVSTDNVVSLAADQEQLPALWLHIPVSWTFTIAYLAGIGIWFLVPVTIGSAVWLVVMQILGILSLALGAILAFWAQWIFRKKHTTTVPTETTTSFVTWGPYRFCRNPMYLGLFLFFAGLSAIATFVWSILLLLVVLFYVNSIVIPVEERQLQRNFGEAYAKYVSRVRRWV